MRTLTGPRVQVRDVPRGRPALRWLALALVLVAATGVMMQQRRGAPPASAPLATPSCGHDAATIEAALTRIAEAATDAQLHLRVAEPWVRGQGMPITAHRLARSDAQLSEVLRAVAAAEAALHHDPTAADLTRKDSR